MVNSHPRVLGAALLGASGGSTLVHRAVHEAVQNGPAQVAELGLGLLTFMLAGIGMLLVIHGSKLFERDRKRRAPPATADGRDLQTRLTAAITAAGRIYDTRHGASLMRARHAITRSKGTAGRRLAVEPALRESGRSGPIAPRH